MPFQSESQRKFMYSQHPALAKEFEAATPKGKKLPYHKAKPKSSTKKTAYYGFMKGLAKGGY